jgi:hypothetical protein
MNNMRVRTIMNISHVLFFVRDYGSRGCAASFFSFPYFLFFFISVSFCTSIYSVLAAEMTSSDFGLGFGLQLMSKLSNQTTMIDYGYD